MDERAEVIEPASADTAMNSQSESDPEVDAYWTNMILTRAAQVWLGEN